MSQKYSLRSSKLPIEILPLPSRKRKIPSKDSILIDDYQFKPLFKYIDDNRILYEIQSIHLPTNTEHIFRVYRSNSENGLLRYCVNRKDKDQYEKGTDYITETFIHLQLQKFISKYDDNIPLITPPSKRCIEDDQEPAVSFFKSFPERLIDIPALDILRLCPAGECFKLYQLKRFLNLDEYLDKYEKNTQIYPYKKELLELRDRLLSSDPYYREFTEIAHSINDKEKLSHPEYAGSFENEMTTVYWQNILLSATNTYLERHITYLGGHSQTKFLYSENSTIHEAEVISKVSKKVIQPEIIITINNNYYSVPAKIDDYPVLLIINKYTFEYVGEKVKGEWFYEKIAPQQNIERCVLINILPVENNILWNGTYRHIISAGFLIGKGFEYASQCGFLNLPYCTEKYQYIGEFVTNLYPTSVICEYPNVIIHK